MKQYNNVTIYSRGQILIELIIATALAGIIISSIIGLFVDIGQTQLVSLEQTQAEEFVEEAIGSLYSIHERSWNNLINYTFPVHPINNNGVWELSEGQEIIDENYVREINIEAVYRNAITGEIVDSGVEDPSTKKFIITVSWQKPRSLSITKEIYLTRYQNNTNWIQTTHQDFNNGTANNIQVTNDSGGELILDYGEGEGEHTGNKFSVFEKSNTSNLNDTNKKISYRFTAQDSKEVRAIRVYINDAHSIPPIYRYGLQADDDGSPSGQWLGDNQQGYNDFWSFLSIWHQISLKEYVDIEEGEIYHLVIEHKSGKINQGHYINLRTLKPLNKIVPYDGSDDENLMIRYSEDNGLSWADVNETPVYVIVYDEWTPREASGNPYYKTADGSIYGNKYKGEIFTYSEETEFISQVGAYVFLKKGTPSQPQDDLYIVIKDLTTREILIDQIFVARDDVSTDFQLKETIFDPALPMVQGHQYRLYFYSNGTAHNRAYQLGVAENWDFPLFNAINYFGSDAQYSRSNDAGNKWKEYNNRDTMFRFSVLADTGYFSNGEYISSTFDAGDLISFNRIFWTELINPGITNVEFQIAANIDNSTWNFVGPDGTSATRFTNPDGETIPISAVLGRYIKYKIYMTTTDNEQTPIVYDVSINYSP